MFRNALKQGETSHRRGKSVAAPGKINRQQETKSG